MLYDECVWQEENGLCFKSYYGITANHLSGVGTFLKLVEDKRIVQQITFESEDPSFAGEMIMTWNLDTLPEGTKVTIVCENVPEGIRQEDHDEGLRSTLENLATYLQSPKVNPSF